MSIMYRVLPTGKEYSSKEIVRLQKCDDCKRTMEGAKMFRVGNRHICLSCFDGLKQKPEQDKEKEFYDRFSKSGLNKDQISLLWKHEQTNNKPSIRTLPKIKKKSVMNDANRIKVAKVGNIARDIIKNEGISQTEAYRRAWAVYKSQYKVEGKA